MWNYSGLTRYRSVLSVIVIILVAAALIGGGVWVQHRGEVARENSTQVATNKGSKGADTTKNGASTSKIPVMPAKNNTSTVTVQQSSSSSSKGSTNSTSTAQSSSTSNSANSTANQSSNLPDTGPSSVPMTAVALSLLTFSVLSYVNSRRLQARL